MNPASFVDAEAPHPRSPLGQSSSAPAPRRAIDGAQNSPPHKDIRFCTAILTVAREKSSKNTRQGGSAPPQYVNNSILSETIRLCKPFFNRSEKNLG
jgi:hypothetical protein